MATVCLPAAGAGHCPPSLRRHRVPKPRKAQPGRFLCSGMCFLPLNLFPLWLTDAVEFIELGHSHEMNRFNQCSGMIQLWILLKYLDKVSTWESINLCEFIYGWFFGDFVPLIWLFIFLLIHLLMFWCAFWFFSMIEDWKCCMLPCFLVREGKLLWGRELGKEREERGIERETWGTIHRLYQSL